MGRRIRIVNVKGLTRRDQRSGIWKDPSVCDMPKSIVNVSSPSSLDGGMGQISHGTAKAGIGADSRKLSRPNGAVMYLILQVGESNVL